MTCLIGVVVLSSLACSGAANTAGGTRAGAMDSEVTRLMNFFRLRTVIFPPPHSHDHATSDAGVADQLTNLPTDDDRAVTDQWQWDGLDRIFPKKSSNVRGWAKSVAGVVSIAGRNIDDCRLASDEDRR